MKKGSLFRSTLIALLLSFAVGCSDKPSSTPIVEVPPAPLVVPTEPPKEVILLKLLNDESVNLIIALEVGGERLYTAKYQRPVWPKGASGVTIGIGLDLGYQTAENILLEWAQHPYVLDLAKLAGLRGEDARKIIGSVQYITTPYSLAYYQFNAYSIPRYYNITRRAFGKDFEYLPDNAKGALVSLVFNRGGSMAGDSRKEMRAIRDECVPIKSSECIAGYLLQMVRVWKNSDIEKAMKARRQKEADFALKKPEDTH